MAEFKCKKCVLVIPTCKWCVSRFTEESHLEKCADWKTHPKGFIPELRLPNREAPCSNERCLAKEERHIMEENEKKGKAVRLPKYTKEQEIRDHNKRLREELKMKEAEKKTAKQAAKEEAARAKVERKAAKQAVCREKAAVKRTFGTAGADGSGGANVVSGPRKRDMFKKLIK